MGLTMDQRKGYAREMAKRYRKASKKKKGQLIEEYLELTGLHPPSCGLAAALLGYHRVGSARGASGQDRGRPAPSTAAYATSLRSGGGRRCDQAVAPLRLPVWQALGGHAAPLVAELRALGGTQQA